MKTFHKGVSYYTRSTVEICFPEDDICCYRCPLMRTEYKPDREYCARTGELLPAPKDIIGFECPLKFEDSKKE